MIHFTKTESGRLVGVLANQIIRVVQEINTCYVFSVNGLGYEVQDKYQDIAERIELAKRTDFIERFCIANYGIDVSCNDMISDAHTIYDKIHNIQP